MKATNSQTSSETLKEKEQISGCLVFRNNMLTQKKELLIIFREWTNGESAYIFPQGHVKQGESLDMAAIRETREETGYKVEIVKFLESFDRVRRNGKEKTVHTYLALTTQDSPDKLILTEKEKQSKNTFYWMPPDEAIELCPLNDEKRLIQKAITILEHEE